MVICAPQYDKRFRSYTILKSARLLKFLCWADLSILRNLSFWPQTKWNIWKLSRMTLYITFSAFRRILTRLTWLSQTQVIAIRKIVRKRGFQRKARNRLGVGAGYELVPKLSYRNNLFRNEVWLIIFSHWAEFKAEKSFGSILPFWDRICPERVVFARLEADLKRYRFRENILHKSCR
jgi:hypothetical protein